MPDERRLATDLSLRDSVLAGQGIRVTLLQLAQACAVIGADGDRAEPHVVARLYQDGRTVREIGAGQSGVLKANLVAAFRSRLAAGMARGDSCYVLGGIIVGPGGPGEIEGQVAVGILPVQSPRAVIAVLIDQPLAGHASPTDAVELVNAIARQIR